ncbi:uncharacterized protein LOC111025316 [Momordica charantia]|uniref:Uncharacterized protein LOC111025316 n=1 Tax=Momordica charantia TaxID=3673 RepID=A0A6J1DY94_MOMCH|nr:uncharacterized protein LOC111025316 [Momordica charantia]
MAPHGYVNFQPLPTLNIPQNSEFRAEHPQQLPPMINPGMYQPFMFNPVPSYHFPLSQMQIPASVHPYGMPNPSTLFPSLPPYYGMGHWVPPHNYGMISPRVPPPPQLPFLERGPQAPQLNPNILSTFNMGHLKPLEPLRMSIPTNMPMDTGDEHGGEQEKSHSQRLEPGVSIGQKRKGKEVMSDPEIEEDGSSRRLTPKDSSMENRDEEQFYSSPLIITPGDGNDDFLLVSRGNCSNMPETEDTENEVVRTDTQEPSLLDTPTEGAFCSHQELPTGATGSTPLATDEYVTPMATLPGVRDAHTIPSNAVNPLGCDTGRSKVGENSTQEPTSEEDLEDTQTIREMFQYKRREKKSSKRRAV